MFNNHEARETSHRTLETCIKHQESSFVHRETSIEHRESVLKPLHLSRELYKSTLFMQNKANLHNDEMNVSNYIIRASEDFCNFFRRKNKAKQTQNKPNLQNAQINISTCNRKEYEIFRPFSRRKNKAKQTQVKPNFSSKLASFSRILALFLLTHVNLGNLCRATTSFSLKARLKRLIKIKTLPCEAQNPH